jgi:hypothetical protein
MNDHSRDIGKAARLRLVTSSYLELRRITCDYDPHKCVLMLRGRVSTYYLKQMAQSRVATIEEVKQIVNSLKVDGSAESRRSRTINGQGPNIKSIDVTTTTLPTRGDA